MTGICNSCGRKCVKFKENQVHFTKTKDMANIMLYKNRWESLLAGKKPRHRYHCIPCRHFIFSALGGHVINRSQYESTIPFTITLFTVYILYKCTCIITILFISIILRGYIVHMCCVIIYIMLRYIVYYTNVWYMHWHCSIV